MTAEPYDVIIIGGGPAGLNAALVLGRCRRRVLLCDAGAPRNAASGGVHGFLSRDGILPLELLRLGREELVPYGVEYRHVSVSEARPEGDGFVILADNGKRLCCRKLLLATGVKDKVPKIENIERFYGRSVFHCPYCDGWEMRDQPLAAYGQGKSAVGLARSLLTWTDDVVLCTDGARTPAANGIRVISKRIARLEGTEDVLERIVFTDGEILPRRGNVLQHGTGAALRPARKIRVCVHTEKCRSHRPIRRHQRTRTLRSGRRLP